MKSLLKKVLVLVITATLFILPTSSAFASTSSVPVLTYHNSDYSLKQFTYQPNPLDVPAYSDAFLTDTTNNSSYMWNVPTGKSINFTVGLTQGHFTATVYRTSPNGQLVYTQSNCSGSFSYTINPVNYDTQYCVFFHSEMNPGETAQIGGFMVVVY